MRIAILAHSTNPRGGVVHAMQLAEALCAMGHDAVLHAPDSAGRGFFRTPLCGHVAIPVAPAVAGLAAMVAQRVADYTAWLSDPAHRDFDVWHAQDGISANALADLAQAGLIPRFARTVHHVEEFADPAVMALQRRGITAAAGHFTVSRLWRDALLDAWGIPSRIVGNGVDAQRFTSHRDGREPALRQSLGLGDGPVMLAIGGFEHRKNTLGILRGFRLLRATMATARLVIAGGASLLDHDEYRRTCMAELDDGLRDAVILAGPQPDAAMPALYRIADALVFPSLQEGFGLVVLEAMASGIPAIVPRIAPFSEYLGAADALWCEPQDPASIAAAMTAALDPARRAALAVRGHAVVAHHPWSRTAAAHLPGYATLLEPAHA